MACPQEAEGDVASGRFVGLENRVALATQVEDRHLAYKPIQQAAVLALSTHGWAEQQVVAVRSMYCTRKL